MAVTTCYPCYPCYPSQHSSDDIFDVKAPVSAVLQVSPLLPAAFTTKIIAPPSPEQMDSFCCLQCHLH